MSEHPPKVSNPEPERVSPAPALAAHSDGSATLTDAGPGIKATVAKKKKKKKKKAKVEVSRFGSSRGVETMFRTSYRQHIDLSALADTKANIMISINGIIMSIVLASISPKIDSNSWLLLPTSVLLLGCLVSMVYAILSARPRVSSALVTLEDVRNNRSNILFFGNFVNMSEDDYMQGMEELLQNIDSLYNNMMRDIYGLGKVLKRKFELLRVSYTVFMFSLIASILLFIGVYIWVVFADPGLGAG